MEIHVIDKGRRSYGGDQRWFEKKELKEVGCGVIACTNLYYALQMKLQPVYESAKVSYLHNAEKISRYMPVLPHLGLDGFRLAAGFSLFCRQEELPYHAYWGLSGSKMFDRIEKMLNERIPVVLGIGRNFPLILAKKKVTLYQKRYGNYQAASYCSGHFVTVYEMDEEWLKVSSWGEVYYVNRQELEDYIRRYSNYCFCNVMVVEGFHKENSVN